MILVENTVKGKKNEDIKIKTKIWDTPGYERFVYLVLSEVKKTEGIFLVYDITSVIHFMI